jgi:prolyl-tRNA synthetase
VKFNDADLLGIPFRVVAGDKNLGLNPPQVEIKGRAETGSRLVPLDRAPEELAQAVRAELARLNG